MANAEVTQLLISFGKGDPKAAEKLFSVVYQELRGLAGKYMRRESKSHTLQPTALVHEAYLKLINQNEVKWQNRSHFYGIAAQIMRRLLIDHARKKKAEKRGGAAVDVAFEEGVHGKEESTDIILLDQLMHSLTDSTLMVGLVNTATLGPVLIFAVWGGAIADRVNRLKLVQITRGMFAFLALLTGLLIAADLIQPRYHCHSAFKRQTHR